VKEYTGLRNSKVIVYEDTLFIKKQSIEKTFAFDEIAGVRFKESGAISNGEITIRLESTGTFDAIFSIAFNKNEKDSFKALFDFLREKAEENKAPPVKAGPEKDFADDVGAKYERQLRGDFDSLLQTLDREILGRSITAHFQGGSDFTAGNNTRCAVRVYERYNVIGGSRPAVNITLLGDGNDLFLSVISAGGSQAKFLKVNTWGESAFTEKIVQIVEDWEKQASL